MSFCISLSQHFEENAVVAFWRVCSITPDFIYSLSYRETDAGFRNGGATPPTILTNLVPSGFDFFWPLKDALYGRHFWSDEEVNERCMAGWQSNQKTSSKECVLCWNVRTDCRMSWGRHWLLMSLYCVLFCNKSLYIILPVFIWMNLVLRG